MLSWIHRKNLKAQDSNLKDANGQNPSSPEAEQLYLEECRCPKHPVSRCFDGPRGVQVPLRIALDKEAYADVVLHAKECLDSEVCGVLVGEICKDEEGLFVSVTAAIRGKVARQERTHVTFTQETWNAIHEEKDRDYPKLQIVGWYHSHPGFGVEMSDMDRFIHKNFFSSETQIALVTDPLGGEAAIVVNTPEGTCNVDRFWVAGREHRCSGQANQAAEPSPAESQIPVAILEAIERFNTRVSQVIQAQDDLRNSLLRFLTTLGLIVCLGLAVAISYYIYSSYTSRLKPPELRTYAPVLVKIGDKSVLLGVGVVQWEVPPELNATYLRAEQMKRQSEEKSESTDLAIERVAQQQENAQDAEEVSNNLTEP